MDPDEAERVFGGGPEKKEDSIEILTQKMNKAILEERYEDAAQFRDDIKVLKGEPKMDNLNKFKKAMREDNEENSDNSEK
jgi:protein-arginine kinase activator protein McsA